MRREIIAPRKNWQSLVEGIGFTFHSIGGCYWNESACYVFSEEEIDRIETATELLHGMCLEAVDYIISHNQFDKLKVPDWCRSRIKESWQNGEPSLYGRFDFSYTEQQGLKMLEYNADTPTSVYEASVVQWHWLKDVCPHQDQFNSIHEKLIERWQEIFSHVKDDSLLHLSSVKGHEEDFLTVEYLRDTAVQAGISTDYLAVEDIGWSKAGGKFVGLKDEEIRQWFKLYPWEWVVDDPFARNLAQASVRVIEPWWKMLLSNKGLLAILWQMFPDHPNLLPASLQPTVFKGGYVRKPLLGREGANIHIISDQGTLRSPGSYGEEGWVFQAPAPLPCFDGNYAVIGSWVVGNRAAGIGIREDDTSITRDTSRFVPHYF